MNAVVVMTYSGCHVVYNGYDVTRVPRVMTYTLVVMSSIEQYIDTDVCAICVMRHIQWRDVKYGG